MQDAKIMANELSDEKGCQLYSYKPVEVPEKYPQGRVHLRNLIETDSVTKDETGKSCCSRNCMNIGSEDRGRKTRHFHLSL